MNNDFWAEIDRLVAEADVKRPVMSLQNRLYYDDNGYIIGLWKTDYPLDGNFILLDDLDFFEKNNTLLLRVKDKTLVLLDPKLPNRTKLVRSLSGFRTIKGHAALLLEENENYSETDYYDRADS